MKRQKRQITVEVFSAYREKPFILEEIQEHARPTDEIYTGHVDEDEYDIEDTGPEYFLNVQRTRLETDEEFAKRCEQEDESHRSFEINSMYVYLERAVKLYGRLLRKERCPLCEMDAIVQDGGREKKGKMKPVFRCEACDTEYFRQF